MNTTFPIPDHEFDPKSRALELGMPLHIWDRFCRPEDMGALQFGNVALAYINAPIVEPTQPDQHYIRAFHRAVHEFCLRTFPGLNRACYYFTGDPDVPPFVVDDANKFMLYANHYLGLQNEEIRKFSERNAHKAQPKSVPKPTNPSTTTEATTEATTQDPNSVVTPAPKTPSPERQVAREAKQRKSAEYAAWLEACAAYRAEVAELRARYEEARDYAEARRVDLRTLESTGAPKRSL